MSFLVALFHIPVPCRAITIITRVFVRLYHRFNTITIKPVPEVYLIKSAVTTRRFYLYAILDQLLKLALSGFYLRILHDIHFKADRLFALRISPKNYLNPLPVLFPILLTKILSSLNNLERASIAEKTQLIRLQEPAMLCQAR